MIRGKFAAVAAVVLLAVTGPATSAGAVAAGGGEVSLPRATQASVIGSEEALPYQIKSRLTGSCLTNPHMSQADGQGMIQWTCPTVSADQQWLLVDYPWYPGFVTIQNVASKKCLTVPSGTNGTQLVQQTCGPAATQLWSTTLGGAGTLQNYSTGQQVGLGSGQGNGVPIVQNFRCGCKDQYWSLVNA